MNSCELSSKLTEEVAKEALNRAYGEPDPRTMAVIALGEPELYQEYLSQLNSHDIED